MQKNAKRKPQGSQAPQDKQGCLGVTWTGGHAGTFLDVLPLTGCASIQWRGVGAAPTPLLPATPTHGTAGRPGGPRGPAAGDCQTGAGGDGEVREWGRLGEG